MSAEIPLQRLEEIVDRSAVAASIEAMLPAGVRARQLSVRTLLLGVMLALVNCRPAHLVRVHEALCSLPAGEKWRLGVIARVKDQEHELTYRQVERTYGLVVRALSKAQPNGQPSQALQEIMDRLLEASVNVTGRPETRALALDWTAYESFARPPRGPARRCADAEAAWGHRTATTAGERETFFGYYLQAATMVREEGREEVPELVRRIHLASCSEDPPAQIVPVIERMAKAGTEISDLLVDSGYSYREAGTFAAPVRAMGAALVMDL